MLLMLFALQIVPHVDSLGLNEQELAFFSHIANGPYTDSYPVAPGAVHVHKVCHQSILKFVWKKYSHIIVDSKTTL